MIKYMKRLIYILIFFITTSAIGQGVSNIWLLGHRTGNLDPYTISLKGTINYLSGNAVVTPSIRKMIFYETQGNISDSNGNLRMSSNGIWIADATGDTMMNGSDLNPNNFTNSWKPYGLVLPYGNVFIPWPGDTTKYVLFHMTGNMVPNFTATELFYSVIDMTLNNGLGAVTLKNQVIFQDNLSWGIGACKHANGRDWWIVAIKDNSNLLYTVLLTPNGIASVTTQSFNVNISDAGNACQPVFSPDGKKFAFLTGHYVGGALPWDMSQNYFDFDRCTGLFSNHQKINVPDGYLGYGSAFSQNSQYLYVTTSEHIFQINTDTIPFNIDTIATYDGFTSPFTQTIFHLMYLAQDHKIYINSGNSVVDIAYINYPDSAGIASDVHQHALHLPCYLWGSVPNHPNYFLGTETGSICDSSTVSIPEFPIHQNLSVNPNPATTAVTINAAGVKGRKGIIYIYNIAGEEIGQRVVLINGGYLTQDVFVGDLSNGIYFVKLQTDAGTAIAKFVKM